MLKQVVFVFSVVPVPSRRPCRMYYVETLGEMADHAWVPGKVTYPFTGGEQFTDLPVLRRRGKQREKDYKYTVTDHRLSSPVAFNLAHIVWCC